MERYWAFVILMIFFESYEWGLKVKVIIIKGDGCYGILSAFGSFMIKIEG